MMLHAKVALNLLSLGKLLPKLLSNEWASLNFACEALEAVLPDKTFWPGHGVHEFETNNFWSNHEIMTPACVVRPTSAEDVAAAVLVSGITASKFAVRGGGHMGIRGANSIDNGPLMVMSNLTTLELAEDKKSAWIGPGNDWGDVYKYLGEQGVAAVGGRLSAVGVPGLLLAGGVNFHGNQRGWAADNVIAYELVLASGEITNVTAKSHPDLFWALKGGSSNFGIVTNFKVNTFPSGQVLAGVYTVSDIDAFLAAIAHFAADNTDPLAHIVPQVVPVSPGVTLGVVILYYDSDSVAEPECFRQFFDIPAISNTVELKTLSQFSDEAAQLITPNINDMFIAGTTLGKTYDKLLRGILLVNDGFLDAMPGLWDILPADNIKLVTVDWQPLTHLWASGSKKYNPGGNPLGFDPETKGTYLAWAEVVEWSGSEYNEQVYSWIKNTTWAIANATKEAGLYDAFTYMGDAAGFQEVYDGYGDENRERLLNVSRKYDPTRVFQRLLPGGFKLGW